MKNKITIITLALIFSSFYSFSQVQITGKVIHAADEQAIEFATVSIFNTADSSLVDGSITEASGQFNLELNKGTYFGEIAFIGFQSMTIDAINIDGSQKVVDLGSFKMNSDATMLDAVEITEEKRQYQYQLDKKVFNVDKGLAAGAGSITEVLDNIPSVTVDGNGGVSLRGSQSVQILIDGKPSAMTKGKLLQNMQAGMVDQVEVITNPSAKYEAEGLSGIINLVLKKEEKVGIAGSLFAGVANPQDYDIGLNLNRRKGKVNLFTNIGLRYWERPKNSDQETNYFFADTSYTTTVDRDKTRRSFSGNINLGMDYSINDEEVITTSFLFDRAHQPHDALTNYQDFDVNNILVKNEFRTNDEVETEQSLEYTLNYEKNYGEKGKKLEAFIKYIDNTEDNESDISEYSMNNLNEVIGDITLQRSAINELDQQYIGQIDFSQVIGEKGNMELGSRIESNKIGNDFLVESLEDNNWSILNNLSNNFTYNEQNYAAYMTYRNQIGKLSYQFGLRGELTKLKTELAQTNGVNDRDPYFNLFPSIHASYKFDPSSEFQVSYSRRIQRPRFGHLNPFFSYTDDRFISTGNPNLNPMFTNSYEVEYMKRWDAMTLGTSVYHRRTTDLIDNFVFVDGEGVTFSTVQNLGTRSLFGYELWAEKEVGKWLQLRGNIDALSSKVEADEFALKNNYNALSGRVSARIKLKNRTQIQVQYMYRGPSESLQGKLNALTRTDLSIRKPVLKGKARMSLSVMDVFNTFKYEFEEITANSTTIGLDRPWRPTLRFSFQYRWE